MNTQISILRAEQQLADHVEMLDLLVNKFPSCRKGIAYTLDMIAALTNFINSNGQRPLVYPSTTN